MLLPALAKAKAKAQQAGCLSNLKQWGLAQQMYISDFHDVLPSDGMDPTYAGVPGYAGVNGTGTLNGPDDPTTWYNLLPPYLATKTLANYEDAPHLNYSTGFPDPQHPQNWLPFPGRAGKHRYGSALASPNVRFRCCWTPARLPALLELVGSFPMPNSIDLRSARVGTGSATSGGGTAAPISADAQGNNLSQTCRHSIPVRPAFQSPTTEPYVSNPADASKYDSQNPGDNRFKELASRHSSGAVLNFCDGHAQYYKDYYVTNDCNFATLP